MNLLDEPASPDDSEPIRAARAWLAGGAAPGALDEGAAGALIAALVAHGDAERLGALAARPEKALAKQARRGLHLLRSRGVAAEIPRPAAQPKVAQAPEAEVPSLASVAIRDGERVIWYVRPYLEGGMEVCQAQLTERDGMVTFQIGNPSRRQWREAEQQITADPLLAIARIPSSYARWLIEEGWQRGVDAGRTPPREYAEARHQLDRPIAPPRHPALDAVEGILASGSRDRVLDLPETRSWIPDEEVAKKAYLELEQLLVSQLMVDERQRREQALAIVRRAAAEALAGPWRARLSRRLLDTAHIIACLPRRETAKGPPRDPLADAALCVAAAAEVADRTLPEGAAAVARGLFERMLPPDEPDDADLPPATAGGLIISP